MPEENEAQESENTPIEAESEETPAEAETAQETPKEAALTKEQKSKLDSFDRIYAENKELKAKFKKSKPVEEKEVSEDKVEEWEGTLDPLENARLGKAISDYSEEELEEIIMPMAKGKYTKNIEGILKAVKDPTVQLAIKAKREKVESEKATPSPTSPANIGGKTDKDIQEMSNKEYGEFLRQNIGKRRTGTRGI